MNKTNTILFVANVAKEHIIKFHIPTIKMLVDNGWIVDVACSGKDIVPYCNRQIELSCNRASMNLFQLLREARKLKNIINQEAYDIVYCHTTVGGFIGRIAAKDARKSGTKVVYLSHGYYFYKGAPILNWAIFYTIEKFLEKYTDSIITINNEDNDIAKKKFSSCKIYSINGIGVDYNKLHVEDKQTARREYRKELNIPLNAIVLIYMAELHKNKNQKFLLRVLKRLLDEKIEDYYLVLPGYDHAGGEYQEYAEVLGIKEHVRFLGWRNDIGALYAMSDICTASSIREGFGLNLVEAMAMGVPVIAARNRGHESIIKDGENGFLVDQNDEQTFCNKIVLLVENNSIRQKFIENGLLTKDLYDGMSVLKEIKNILKDHLK